MTPAPVMSLRYPTEESSMAAREFFRLTELDRQARTASWCIGEAFKAARDPSDDFRPWAHLQGGLFAAIVTSRILSPGRVKKAYPHHSTLSESQHEADERGARLRELLGVPETSPLLKVTEVRNALEHFDEHLDIATGPDVFSVSDWYIGTNMVVRSADYGKDRSLGLRTYCPILGKVLHDGKELDLFALDQAMYQLRQSIAEMTPILTGRIKGRGRYGGKPMELDLESAQRRCNDWLEMREAVGDPISM